MEISKEARDRIFAAANMLYEQAGHVGIFPTVDAVRKLAKVNMNDASAGMKEWRRAQSAQAAPVAVQVPEAVQQAGSAAVAALWQEAQDLANESLRAAQAGWEAERIEAETLTKQIGDAYEALVANFDAAQLEIGATRASLDQAEANAREFESKLDATTQALTAAEAATVTAEARIVEIKHRADELRVELDYSHQETAQAREELAAVRQAHQVEIEALRAAMASQQARTDDAVAKAEGAAGALKAELTALHAKHADAAREAAATTDALRSDLATVRAKAEAAQESLKVERTHAAAEVQRLAQHLDQAKAERDQVAQTAAQAREEAATLRGRMDAITEQNAQLMQSVKGAQARGSLKQ